MYTTIKVSAVVLLCFILPSCTNALYFYETDKISLTAELRPDSTQPIQGNLGIKQRVALVTPSINGQGGGEGLSAISSFRFGMEPQPGLLNLPMITIRTALITGDAASQLNDEQAAKASVILSFTGELEKQNEAIEAIGERVMKNGGSLSKERLITMFKCFGFPDSEAQRIAERYIGLDIETFKKEFKKDFRFHATRMNNCIN